MHAHSAPPVGAQPDVSQTTTDGKGTTVALLSIASLAGVASLYTGLMYGYDRAGLLGAAVGAACALACLLAPRQLVAATKGRDVARALAAAAMLAVAIPVAVSAALGAAATAREQAARLEAKSVGDRQRVQAAYDRAAGDLARLPATRPIAVIETDLASVLKDGRLNDCQGWLESSKLRTVCIEKVEPSRKELATAQERARLLTALDGASHQLGGLAPAKAASLDAASLSRLAGRLGVHVTADQVTDALLVLLVAATELLGGLALALVGTGTGTRAAAIPASPPRSGSIAVLVPPVSQVPVPTQESAESEAIAKRLEAGPLIGRQRDLAAMFDLPITTFRRRVESLPNVRLIATPTGSRLELATGY